MEACLTNNFNVHLSSNSYWLGEDIPCLTYGLRGVIHSTLTITSKNVDLHSGVDGGAVSEPLIDMVKVLSELVNPDRTAKIPGMCPDIGHFFSLNIRNFF